MNQNIITINGVSKQFDNHQVLSNININLYNQEIVGLVGLNGIGKTTLIKIILGLINQFEGECRIFDNPSAHPESRANLFYLPEKFNPPMQLTGYEFIKASNRFYNVQTNKEYLQECCNLLRFDFNKISHKMNAYSKGMVQKIGLLAMMSSQTKLWILDEPMSGLDPVTRFEVKQILKNHRRNNGSVLFTSHLLSDIEEIADRLLILHDTEIKFNGSLEQLYQQYQLDNIEAAYLAAIEYADT